MIRNPHDKQIPEMSLGVQFDQEFMEKTWKRLVANCSSQTIEQTIEWTIEQTIEQTMEQTDQ